ncbi:type II CRISPR-associated endonuclease Cas1 [uncultured Polaribacter sp.]|uniref:type II CRISPR-associated endonuclease Cas1 n=1 Tax=uncultured Polaribacter sp. TaxID=174711 RepID=UPI0026373F4F|nr:type II CRISPR-associated endonuclease Cas1 [uncultured Polaribacter sp.]
MIKRTLFFAKKFSLTTKNNQLVISNNEVPDKTIPIEDIGYIVIENQQTYISIPALNKLNENNVAVIFCNEKHLPQSMLLTLDNHHIQHELFKHQVNASEPLKKQLWQQVVQHKIHNQAALLHKIGKNKNPLAYHESKVLSGDTTNREAVAAAFYWKNIFDFNFKRERTGIYPNLFLNYGYIILRAAVARALSGSGLLNTLGIHHSNKYNAFCLADDIMEPYRPLIDAKVIEIMQKYDEQDLITPIKIELLSVLTQTVYFEDKKSPLMVALSNTTSSLQNCFLGKSRKINYPKLWI